MASLKIRNLNNPNCLAPDPKISPYLDGCLRTVEEWTSDEFGSSASSSPETKTISDILHQIGISETASDLSCPSTSAPKKASKHESISDILAEICLDDLTPESHFSSFHRGDTVSFNRGREDVSDILSTICIDDLRPEYSIGQNVARSRDLHFDSRKTVSDLLSEICVDDLTSDTSLNFNPTMPSKQSPAHNADILAFLSAADSVESSLDARQPHSDVKFSTEIDSSYESLQETDEKSSKPFGALESSCQVTDSFLPIDLTKCIKVKPETMPEQPLEINAKQKGIDQTSLLETDSQVHKEELIVDSLLKKIKMDDYFLSQFPSKSEKLPSERHTKIILPPPILKQHNPKPFLKFKNSPLSIVLSATYKKDPSALTKAAEIKMKMYQDLFHEPVATTRKPIHQRFLFPKLSVDYSEEPVGIRRFGPVAEMALLDQLDSNKSSVVEDVKIPLVELSRISDSNTNSICAKVKKRTEIRKKRNFKK